MKNVLFLCTGNSARSVLAEAYLNHAAGGRYRGYSAGSHPTGHVNPFALELLAKAGLPTSGLRSKSWDEFARPEAPKIDFVFTVCDSAAAEICPIWPGQPSSAFKDALTGLSRRIDLFLALPLDKLERHALKRKLDEIGGR